MIRKFIQNNRGVAAVELALSMPLLLALSIGGFEMTRYLIIQQKVSKTVSSMSDLVSRSETISNTAITNMYAAVNHLMEPYPFGANGVVIISSISNNGTYNVVNWQRFGGGTYAGISRFGVTGARVTLPAGFTLSSGEDTIVAEIYYSYRPVVAPDVVSARLIYKYKFSKGRLGSLTTISSS